MKKEMKMDKFCKCFFGRYFGEYSMRICDHHSNKGHSTDFNCKKCKFFETSVQHRIKKLRKDIENKEAALKKLIEEEKLERKYIC